MWQLLLAAAAAAGSTGLVARYLFSPNTQISEGDLNEKEKNPFDYDVKYHSPIVHKGLNASGSESNCENQERIFRFSSPESGGKSGSKNVRKKKVKSEKRSGGGIELSRRRVVSVCLKKRRTSNNGAAKRGACSSKASKAEISKLNTTMNETAKVVQQLKSKLYRRKSSCSVQFLSSANDETENLEKISYKQTKQLLTKSRSGNIDLNDRKVLGFPLVDDGECTSSVLTEEQDAEIMEMDQLEAELESELQKMPLYTTESSCHEDKKLNLHEVKLSVVSGSYKKHTLWIRTEDLKTNVPSLGLHEVEGQSFDDYQIHGVSPIELDQKLSRLLIEEQEKQIVDLESELYSAQSKLCEKEDGLQALKDCIKRFTEFSLSTIPGDETKAQEPNCTTIWWDRSNEVELEPRLLFGKNRPIGT